MASCLSKLLEWSILLTWSKHFATSDLQFGFKGGYSTSLCTAVLKSIAKRYTKGCSRVYACLIDASKAFDTVNHHLLFEKLLERELPVTVTAFLLKWYRTQMLQVRWNGQDSTKFSVTNGVRQGGVLSPILFTIYIDSLITLLEKSGRGCYWVSYFVGAMCYADDLTILAPSPDALQKMLQTCENFADAHYIRFNAEKTQLICFVGVQSLSESSALSVMFCDKQLHLADSVVHLGNYLTSDLSDDLDIRAKTAGFMRPANCVLLRFGFLDPSLKTRLFRLYCLSLYGGCLWDLRSRELRSLELSFNNLLRRLWRLPRSCHTTVVHLVANLRSLYNVLVDRFLCFARSTLNHPHIGFA